MDAGDHGCRFGARLTLLSKVGALAGTLDYEEALILGGDAPNSTSWLVVLKRIE